MQHSLDAEMTSEQTAAPEPVPVNFETVSVAITEYAAARRLGLSVDTLRRDRRLGHLGIPFIKYAAGKRGPVRYDIKDLDEYVAAKKRRGLTVARPVIVERPVVQSEPVEPRAEEPEIVVPSVPRRPAYHRSPWDAMAEAAMAAEPEADPFATGRSAPRRPAGYFSGR
jgi:hypothetical protein